MEKARTLIISTLRHELISGSFYIFLGTTISSLLAFILNLFLVRNLTYADYGIFASLISVILLLTIPAQSLTAVIVRYAAKFFTTGEDERAGAFYFKLFKYLIVFCLFVILGFVVLSPIISEFLKIDDFSVIFITGITVAAFYLATLNIAFLQSMLLFKKLSALYIISGIGKLITGIVLVYAGLKSFGALFGNLMFPIISYFGSLVVLKKVIAERSERVNIPVKEFVDYALPTTIAVLALSSFISTDVILVKHYFPPIDAGIYGGLSLIGRVIFYFTGPIPIVMFPLVVNRFAKKENYNNLLYLSLFLVLLPAVCITIFYFILPQFTINIFLGGRAYLTLIPLIGIFGIFLTLYSLNNVFVSFLLAIKKTNVALIVFIFALLQVILIYLYHDSFIHIIWASIAASVLLLFFLILYYLKINGINYSKK